MKTHVTVLGVLHIVFGVLGVLLAIGLLVLFGGIAGVVATQDLSDDEGAEFAIPVLGTLGVGLFVYVAKLKTDLLKNTPVAVVISLLIAIAYFHIVDHYLMDMQGLDYWYLFRK